MDYTVVASADMDAPPDRVYAIIADYHNGHPHILPKQFRNLTVEKGGVGAGTIIRFEVRALGQTQRFRGFVTEPEPGRVLVEEYVEPAASKTTFFVEKAASGSGTRVTFTTHMTSRDGLAGALERFISTRFMKKLYAEELVAARGTGEAGLKACIATALLQRAGPFTFAHERLGGAAVGRTPSTSSSGDPIMKSTCTALRLPPARSNSSSPMCSPPRSVNLYAEPSATWLAAFSSNSVL